MKSYSYSMKFCRDFAKGNCQRENCKFIHDKNACRNYVISGDCTKPNCRFKHGQPKKKRNTQDFSPDHSLPDMRVLCDMVVNNALIIPAPRDVILYPALFSPSEDLYNKLLSDMKGYEKSWKLWHGDSHLIADDKSGWKSETFNYIISKIANYFNMDIKATRFNWYENDEEWKPYHHDAAAIKPDKARTQNFTVGLSLGATRDIAFQHAKTNSTIFFPLQDAMTYAFARDTNIIWRHGVPQIPPHQQKNQGRISIIAWGKVYISS